MVAAVTIHAMEFGRTRAVFNADGELRYEIVGRYIREKTPSHAVFLTMLHSGSVRHYSGRLTVRYDWLMPEQFEPMVTHLRQRGYAPYLLLDDAEVEDFRRHFSGAPVVKQLDASKVTLPRVEPVSPLTPARVRDAIASRQAGLKTRLYVMVSPDEAELVASWPVRTRRRSRSTAARCRRRR